MSVQKEKENIVMLTDLSLQKLLLYVVEQDRQMLPVLRVADYFWDAQIVS